MERLCREASELIAKGDNIIIISDRAAGADRVPIPALLATAGVHHHLVREGTRLQAGLVVESGEPREVHHICCLLGYGASARQPVPRARDAARHVRPGAPAGRRVGGRRRAELRQGDGQGHPQDDLEDGHLDRALLRGRADLRGGRPEQGPDRQLLHAHDLAHRRHRHRRARDRGARAAPARVPGDRRAAAGRRRAPVAALRRAPPVEPGDDRARPARGAPRRPRDLRRVLAARQRRVTRAHDAARPAQDQGRRAAGPDRGGRAGQRDRQALLDRRDVARLDLVDRARDARDRDEPPRRQVEHGRGRGGPAPLHARPERRLAPLGDQAGGVGPLRRDRALPRQLGRDADQDRPGREAGRGRPAARPQGRRVHREDPPLDAGRGPDLAAAAPRHLLDRGPQAADLRPAHREPDRQRLGEARRRRSASARSPPASRRRTPTTS